MGSSCQGESLHSPWEPCSLDGLSLFRHRLTGELGSRVLRQQSRDRAAKLRKELQHRRSKYSGWESQVVRVIAVESSSAGVLGCADQQCLSIVLDNYPSRLSSVGRLEDDRVTALFFKVVSGFGQICRVQGIFDFGVTQDMVTVYGGEARVWFNEDFSLSSPGWLKFALGFKPEVIDFEDQLLHQVIEVVFKHSADGRLPKQLLERGVFVRPYRFQRLLQLRQDCFNGSEFSLIKKLNDTTWSLSDAIERLIPQQPAQAESLCPRPRKVSQFSYLPEVPFRRSAHRVASAGSKERSGQAV